MRPTDAADEGKGVVEAQSEVQLARRLPKLVGVNPRARLPVRPVVPALRLRGQARLPAALGGARGALRLLLRRELRFLAAGGDQAVYQLEVGLPRGGRGGGAWIPLRAAAAHRTCLPPLLPHPISFPSHLGDIWFVGQAAPPAGNRTRQACGQSARSRPAAAAAPCRNGGHGPAVGQRPCGRGPADLTSSLGRAVQHYQRGEPAQAPWEELLSRPSHRQ